MTTGEAVAIDERFDVILPVRLRACTAADLPALEWGGAYTHHRELIAAAYRRQQAGAVVMIVAETGRALAGQIWVDLERRRRAGAGFLWALRVAPWIEGRGLGTRLLAAAERVVAAAGLGAAEIGAEVANAGALRLYERLGYERVERVTEQYGYAPPGAAHETVTIEEWMLRKRIAPIAMGRGPDEQAAGGSVDGG